MRPSPLAAPFAPRGYRAHHAVAVARVSVLAAVALLGCGALEPIEANSCGNKVLEPEAGEDCDGEPGCYPPGDSGACRYRCTPAAGPLADGAALFDCPTGFGCGLDGVCRRASGHFSVTEEHAAASTVGLSIGDVDADGRADVVRTSVDTTYVELYDEQASLAARQSFFRAPDLIAVGDLTGDGRADLAFRVERGEGVAAGLAVMRAQPDRTLTGSIYAALPDMHTTQGVGVTVNALPPFTEDELVIFLDQFTIGGTPVPLCPDNPTTISGVPNELDAAFLSCSDVRVENISGVLAADFIEDPVLSPCTEVAFAGVGASEVWVLTPCRFQAGAFHWSSGSSAEPRAISLQDGTVLDLADPTAPGAVRDRSRSLHTGDLNGDGHLDLLVTTKRPATGEQPGLHLAYGLGNGEFHSLPNVTNVVADMSAAPFVPDYDAAVCEGPMGALLAVGDLNDDGVSDLCTEHMVLVSDTSTGHAFVPALCGQSFKRAALADFNGTGELDLVALRAGAGGVDFFAGAGDGSFSHTVLATELGADRLMTGDFDGDLISDAAFVRLGTAAGDAAASDSERAQIFVAFGQPWAPPAAPQSVGEIAGVEQALTGRHEGADSTSDILLVVRQEHLGIAVISGDGSRQLWGPFMFPVSKDNRPVITSLDALAYGHFDAGAALGFAALTHDDPALGGYRRAWRLRATGEADLVATRAAESMGETTLDCQGCRLVAVDLDADGIDEAVSFDSERITTYGVRDGELEKVGETTSAIVLATALSAPTLAAPRVADLDLDGLDEVMLVDATGALWVLWNDGSGELDPDGAASTLQSPLPGGEPIVDVAVLNADDDPEPEVVVLTASGRLGRFDLEPDGHALAPADGDGALTIDGVALSFSPAVIAAGDVDGDGVDDLVVGGPAGTSLLRGLRVRP